MTYPSLLFWTDGPDKIQPSRKTRDPREQTKRTTKKKGAPTVSGQDTLIFL